MTDWSSAKFINLQESELTSSTSKIAILNDTTDKDLIEVPLIVDGINRTDCLKRIGKQSIKVINAEA